MRRSIIMALSLVLLSASAFGLNVSVAQLDASRLLLTQNVDAYVSVTDDAGVPVQGLTQEAFTVFESPDNMNFTRIDWITGFTANSGSTEGITFMLLIDNSGSMYDTLNGTKTTDPALMRITHVKNAVRTFLSSMTNPRDRVGLVAFNTYYTRLSAPVSERDKISGLLDSIQKPTTDEAYTELYAALEKAARDFAGISGRKAIIVLSDGENFPFAQYSGKPHPIYGTKIFQYTEPIQACQEEGVTVYAIDFAQGRDKNIQAIAHETGGQVFDASNSQELARIYESIHRQVAAEYRITYHATTAPAEKKYVRVEVTGASGTAAATRFYLASTVFGLPMSSPSFLLLIPFLLAIILLWLLTMLKLERKPGPASLEVIQTQVGRPLVKTIVLGGAKTVIGHGTGSNLTIVGAPQVKEQHATIIFDPKDKSYTVVGSGGDVMVNNQPVKSRKLEPGDVLDVGGATIVFDESTKEKKKGPDLKK